MDKGGDGKDGLASVFRVGDGLTCGQESTPIQRPHIGRRAKL